MGLFKFVQCKKRKFKNDENFITQKTRYNFIKGIESLPHTQIYNLYIFKT